MWWIVGLLVAIALILLRILAALEPIHEYFRDRLDERRERLDDAEHEDFEERISRTPDSRSAE